VKNRIHQFRAAVAAACMIALPALAGSNGPAPGFSLGSRAGSEVNLAQYKGQVVMLNFWASWCGPCRQEMPLLENIYKKYNKMGFTLLGVNVEPESKDAEKFLGALQAPVSFPILYDKDSKVSKLYDVSGMPSTVIIDRKGNVREIHKGYKPGDENGYLDSIRTLIRE
jgi:thiol-disulfide isomerase/thioredoxin